MAAFPARRHNLDGLHAHLGADLAERRVAALGLDLAVVPLPVAGAICVGETHRYFFWFGGRINIGFVGPRSFSDNARAQIARCTSFVGAGAQPSWHALR